MPNPFFQSQYRAVNPNVNNMANYRSIYNMLTSSKNPTQLIMQMAQQNPALQPALNFIKSGQNPEVLFNQLCQQRGINPQEFINQVTGN